MTKPKPSRTCAECRFDGGWHYDDNGNATRCANYLAADQHETAQELAKLAHANAWEAAQRIIEDAAHARAEFSANDLALDKDFGEAWQAIPETLHGSAFTWAAKKGLIESTGRMVKHRDQAVRHKISQWSSLVYGRRVSA